MSTKTIQKKNYELKEISISEITISKTNPRKSFDEVALKDLEESIKEHGILQSILIRPLGSTFELICGERRMKVATLLKMKTIPCKIINVTDNEAFEMQIVENLIREDVHPLNEAEAFKLLLEKNNYTIENISDKVSKSQSYVVQRLELNNLIPKWKKLFIEKEEVTISYALVISKLTEKDQKVLLKETLEWDKSFKSLKELKKYIERNIINSLDKVEFDLTDKNLVKKAGSCLDCVKRSGANKLLFADVKEDDRCFDRICFELKTQINSFNKVKDIVENSKECVFLFNSYSNAIPTKIKSLIDSYKLSVLKKYDDFNSSKAKEKGSIKGIWVNGDEIGKIEYIKLIKKEIGKKKADDCTPKELIEKIEVREIRSKELDQEKVHKRIVDEFVNVEEFNKIDKLPSSKIDVVMYRYLLFNGASWMLHDVFKKELKLKHTYNSSSNSKQISEELFKLTDNQIAFAVRNIAYEDFKSSLPSYKNGKMLRYLSEQFKEIDIKKFEKEQTEVATKRQDRQKERIDKLKKIK